MRQDAAGIVAEQPDLAPAPAARPGTTPIRSSARITGSIDDPVASSQKGRVPPRRIRSPRERIRAHPVASGARRHDARARGCLQDEVGRPLRDHDDGRVRVPARCSREHRCIDDTETFDTPYSQLGIDDRLRARPHGTRPGEVLQGVHRGRDVRIDPLVGLHVGTGIELGPDPVPERRLSP